MIWWSQLFSKGNIEFWKSNAYSVLIRLNTVILHKSYSYHLHHLDHMFRLGWCLTSQSTIFQSYCDVFRGWTSTWQWNSGFEVIKLFSCSTQLSTKFILLINVKMPTIVGILTFISRINTTSESFKARKIFISHHFTFYEQLKFHAQLIWASKKFYNLGAKCLAKRHINAPLVGFKPTSS